MGTIKEALGTALAVIVFCVVVPWDLAIRVGKWFLGIIN